MSKVERASFIINVTHLSINCWGNKKAKDCRICLLLLFFTAGWAEPHLLIRHFFLPSNFILSHFIWFLVSALLFS